MAEDPKHPSDSAFLRFKRAAANVSQGAEKLAGKAADGVRKVRENPKEALSDAAQKADELGRRTKEVGQKAWKDRDEISRGASRGAKDGLAAVIGLSAGRESEVAIREELLATQAKLYRELRRSIPDAQKLVLQRDRELLLDSIMLGGASLADHLANGSIPEDVLQAYELQYPSSDYSLVEEIHRLDPKQILGLVSGVKGKLFELKYLDFLNGGGLPDGYHAVLAELATQPGWDISVTGPDSEFARLLQLKATDSTAYVKHALDVYPHIDVVTTSEVQSHLLMQGMSDHVADGGISNADLTAEVDAAFDKAHIHLHSSPSVAALALIAWTALSRDDLEAYEKGRNIGSRSMQSWMAKLAGGVIGVATQTWWLTILGSIGTRFMLAKGHAMYTKLHQLDELIASNRSVLLMMDRRAAQ